MAKYSFELPPPNFLETPLMMSMGVIFAMIVVFFRLGNSSKMRSVFLRYDIGMPSELSSAKMERVLASLRVQSYNAKKRNPNFLQIRSISKTQNDENENTRLIMGRQQNPMFDYLSKNNISRASLTPLGRVFKIRKIFP